MCTPLGLARMFSVTGKLLVKPRVCSALCPLIPAKLEPDSEATLQLFSTHLEEGHSLCWLLYPSPFPAIWGWSPDMQARAKGSWEGLDQASGHGVVNETVEPGMSRGLLGALRIGEPLTVSPSLSPVPSC